MARVAPVFAVAVAFAASLARAQHRKDTEPKSQVLPLPPEPPMALMADTASLDFHISRLLTSGGLAAQIKASLNDLIRDTHGESIVKLRAFVSGAGDGRRVQSTVTDLFSEHHLALPVLSILQVGTLGSPAAQVIIEATVATPRIENPAGLGFFFGQTGATFGAAAERLKFSTTAAGLPNENVLSVTCFASELDAFEPARDALHASFPKADVNVVEPMRDPIDNSVQCEAVGKLATPPAEMVQHLASANATLVNAPRLVFTGLQLSFGSYLDDAHEAFERLRKSAGSLAETETPVQVDGFSLDRSAASALRKTNSLAPGVFTVETVEGLSSMDATGGIEAILAASGQPGAK